MVLNLTKVYLYNEPLKHFPVYQRFVMKNIYCTKKVTIEWFHAWIILTSMSLFIVWVIIYLTWPNPIFSLPQYGIVFDTFPKYKIHIPFHSKWHFFSPHPPPERTLFFHETSKIFETALRNISPKRTHFFHKSSRIFETAPKIHIPFHTKCHKKNCSWTLYFALIELWWS